MFKKLLIDFLEKKSKLIKKQTNIDYIYQEDIYEIENEWLEHKCKYVLSVLSYSAMNSCPWCIINKDDSKLDCEECGYGYRHGICTKGVSLFSCISRSCGGVIMSIPGMPKLIKDTSEKYRSLNVG